jgi:hypothetical protein
MPSEFPRGRRLRPAGRFCCRTRSPLYVCANDFTSLTGRKADPAGRFCCGRKSHFSNSGSVCAATSDSGPNTPLAIGREADLPNCQRPGFRRRTDAESGAAFAARSILTQGWPHFAGKIGMQQTGGDCRRWPGAKAKRKAAAERLVLARRPHRTTPIEALGVPPGPPYARI